MIRVLVLLFVAAEVRAAASATELHKRALALMEQSRLKEAVAMFREALQSAPRDAELLNDLGVALRKDGDLSERKAHYAFQEAGMQQASRRPGELPGIANR